MRCNQQIAEDGSPGFRAILTILIHWEIKNEENEEHLRREMQEQSAREQNPQ